MEAEIVSLAGKFRKRWKNYLGQSLLAIGIFSAVLLLLNVQENPIITASVGATTFVVFAIPSDVTANARNIIGGHAIGVLAGALSGWVLLEGYSFLFYSMAVGISIFLMVVTDCEHPPASGTALGLAITGPQLGIVLTLFLCIIPLAVVHEVFRSRLRDLR
jgi:CBS-domain-containing membrane protein